MGRACVCGPRPTRERGADRPVLDASHLAALHELGPAHLRNLIPRFIDDAAGRIVRLREALERGQSDEIASLAHSLKGSSGAFGASVLAETCSHLEAAALESAVSS